MLLMRLVSWGTPVLIVVLPKIGKMIRPRGLFYGAVYVGSALYFYFTISSIGNKLIPYTANIHLIR